MQAHIFVNVPDVRQTHPFDCGPACLRSIAKYFGVNKTEDDLIELCGADPDGADPHDIVKVAKSLGLEAEFHNNFTAEKLKAEIDKGRPVICEIQAWGKPQNYDKLNDGHYVIAVGYDDEYIFFEDPSLKFIRGFLTYEEMESRWKERENDGSEYHHSVVVVWQESHPQNKKILNKARHIN